MATAETELTSPPIKSSSGSKKKKERGYSGFWVFSFLSALLIGSILFSIGTGAMHITPPQLVGIISTKLGIASSYTYDEQHELVLWIIRLPRICLGILIGAGLGIAGASLQGLFRNSLADPGLIGISSGASLFAVIFIVLNATYLKPLSDLLGSYALSIVAFFGASFATFLIYRLSKSGGQTMVATMLLLGVAINAFSGGVMGLMTYLANDEQLRNLTFWNLGSLGGASWDMVTTLAPFVIFTLIFVPRLAKSLNLLALGESQAAHLGVNLKSVKQQVILLATLAVGASVAVAGIIGFVGLIVPHIIRRAFGPDHYLVLPGSALGGAALLTFADTLSRTIVAPTELPIGVLTALMGTPIFVYMLLKEKQQQYD